MKTALRFRRQGLVVLVPLLGLIAGCGASHARYTPTSGEARSSLEAALTAWRDGKAFGEVPAKPPVHMVDSAWQAGQQIESFEIGDEEDGGDGTKQFPVKLTMKNAKGGPGRSLYRHRAATRSGSLAPRSTSIWRTWTIDIRRLAKSKCAWVSGVSGGTQR